MFHTICSNGMLYPGCAEQEHWWLLRNSPVMFYSKTGPLLLTTLTTLQVKALVGAIRGLESAQEAVMEFQDVRCSLTSELLRSIVTPGCVFPDVSSTLSDIATAADWSLAEETGRVIPLQVWMSFIPMQSLFS